MSRFAIAATAFTSTLLAIGLASSAIEGRDPGRRAARPYQATVPSTGGEWYLAFDGDTVDHDVILGGWWGVVPYLRQADVLFVGNSRAAFGFRPEVLQPWLDRLGLRGYNMAFFGGTYELPLAIIRKHDLRPRFVVISADSFFSDESSPYGEATLARSRWDSARYVASHAASWQVRRLLHRWVPPWREYLTEPPHGIVYRSVRTGAFRFVFAQEDPHVLTGQTEEKMTPEQIEKIKQTVEQSRPHFLTFVRELKRRGAQVVMTVVPPGERHVARALVKDSPYPYIDVWPPGLVGIDHTHLNERSARIFGDALMQQFVEIVGRSQP